MTTVVRGGRVICPKSGRDGLFDVVIKDGRVADVVAAGSAPSADVDIDATGAVVLPAGVDLDVAVRDPGREDEEPLDVTLAVAARGGFGAIVASPRTSPVVDGGEDVEHRRARAASAPGAELLVAGALTMGCEGKELAEIGEMKAAGAVAVTDGSRYVADGSVLRHGMDYARGFGLPVIAGGAVPELSAGVIAETPLATRLGLAGVPEAAETAAVYRHIELARLTGARVHLGPVSAARSVELVSRAQDEGVAVTAAVHPWHLLFDEGVLLERRYDTALRLWPVLRTASDRDALLDGVKAGRLLVTSGHRPVSPRFKEVEFARAEPGAVSLSTCLPSLLDTGDGRGLLGPMELARASALLPALFLGRDDLGHLEPGARANLAVLGAGGDAPVNRASLGTVVFNTPLLGRALPAEVRCTLVAGVAAYRHEASTTD